MNAVTSKKGALPTDTSQLYIQVQTMLPFSEHWPGGDYRSALDTGNSATPTIARQQFQIGNSYTATVTYDQGARFIGYTLE